MSWNDGSFGGPDKVAAKVDRLTASDVYNWKPENTRRQQRALAGSGSALCDLVFIGDGQTYQRNTSTWVNFLRNRLQAMGYPIAGTGWVWSNDGFNNYDARISKSGTWGIVGTHSGAGYTTSTAAGSMTFVSDMPGTTIGVAYLNTSAGFTVTVDGGSAVAVTPDTTSTVGIYTVTGLSDAPHTIVVTTSSATPVMICGFRCDRTTGVRLHNLAGNGWEAEGFYSNPGTTHPVAIINTMVPAPAAVHAAFGLGDVAHGRTAAQLANNIQNFIRGYFAASDFILYAGMENATGDLSTHVRAMYDVADALDIPFVDVWKRSGGPSGGYAIANANGLMADTQNPSAKGHHLWADAPARLMASVVATPASIAGVTAPTANALALRDSDANLSADNFIATRVATVTAAGTTTLTISDPKNQVFTGSTTQTVLLPTTGIVAGQEWTVNNQSSGVVTVQSSGANTLLAMPASRVATYTARVDTPTGSGDWIIQSLTISPSASSGTVAQRDGNAIITANNFVATAASTVTAAGTTTLTISSSQTQVFTGSTTQTVKLPTTSVVAGQEYRVINNSSGSVTVQSSGANTVATVLTNTLQVFIALVSTPTTAANWRAI